jgi:hypothetical protein
VGGNVQVVQGGRGKVVNSRVGGDILFDEQDGRVAVKNSSIGGDVQAFQNNSGVVIQNNLIGVKTNGAGGSLRGRRDEQEP